MSRINVYEEELTSEVEIVETSPEPGRTFYGVRIFLKSHPDLHHTIEDDDRSAITFWVNTHVRAEMMRDHLRRDLSLVVGDNGAPPPPRASMRDREQMREQLGREQMLNG